MIRTLAIIAAIGIGAASPVMAQGPSGWGPGWGMGPSWGPGWGPGWGMMMGGMDFDQNGDISAEEAASHAEAMFALMDADTDGALVADEFGAGRMGMMSPWAPGMAQGMQERHAARFAAKDGDGDGKVTMAEFLAAEKAQYEAADGDGDGKVTPWELRAAMWQ